MVIDDFSFEDGYIRGILVHKNTIDVQYELWNGNKIIISFLDYIAVKDIHSIDCETSELMCMENSSFRNELVKDVLSGDGSLDEIKDVKSFSFISSWGDRTILEILAVNLKFRNLE